MQKRASRLEYGILGVLAFLIVGGCAFGLYGQQITVFFRGLEPSCNVGISTATITVQGWSANSDCQAMVAGANNFTGINWPKLGVSVVSEASGPTTSCELDMGGRHLIVRDSTPISNNGTIVCEVLQGILPPP